jgi:TolB-like protein
MTSSTNSLSRGLLILPVVICFLAACGSATTKRTPAAFPQKTTSIAVFPLENLSGTVAPVKAVRELLMTELKGLGIPVLDEQALERFMAKRRLRYTAGVDETIAQALKSELGVDGVLLASLELFSPSVPPKIAFAARLIATGQNPSILWIDGVGLAGDDHPGLLGLGLIEDPEVLTHRALSALTGSLERYLSGAGKGTGLVKAKSKFQPKTVYRSASLGFDKKLSVAVAPFFNESERKNAGDMLVLQFVRGLSALPDVSVLEPGLIRNAFLTLRIIMDQGVSLTDASALFSVLDADFVLAGRVFDYQDYQGTYGKPKVSFSVQLIEKRTQKIVWSSASRNTGDDGVYFFDVGRVNTVNGMTAQMVQSIGQRMVGR